VNAKVLLRIKLCFIFHRTFIWKTSELTGNVVSIWVLFLSRDVMLALGMSLCLSQVCVLSTWSNLSWSKQRRRFLTQS